MRISRVQRSMTNNSDEGTRISMQGVHVELTAAMRNAINEKFSVLVRHDERIVRVNVTLHQDQLRGKKHHYTATGRVELRGPDIVATVKSDDAYAALDGLVEKLDEQLRERHERRTDRRRHPQEIDLPAEVPKMGAEQL
jgi:putative sigma-54 modulation protein